MKNGTPIVGATGASYTIPTAVASDDHASFAVTVQNSVESITSSAATLSVGPRAPKQGDWRFQGLDLPSSGTAFLSVSFGVLSTWSNQPAIGTPLQISTAPDYLCVPGLAYRCGWHGVMYYPPTDVTEVTASYEGDIFSRLESDLEALNTRDSVITGLDLQPANEAFGISWLQTSQGGGFTLIRQWVAPANVQAVATLLGQESQVITALSFNADQVYLLSYGWQNDTTTIYEVKVVHATGETVTTEAANLAAGGYIITAMGGDPANGVLLVGTRVQGDTMARPFSYFSSTTGAHGQVPSGIQTLLREVYTSGPDRDVWISEQ